MTRDEVEFSVLSHEAEAGFDELVAIYQASIVASERKPVSELAGMLSNPCYRFLVASVAGRTAGFAVSFVPAGGAFWLLEYLAVDTRLRSHGLGRIVFSAAERDATGIAGSVPCLIEVDQPSVPEASGNQAQRRLKFYRSAGCRRIVGLDYILPLDVAGPPGPMWLLVRGLEDRDQVPKADVADWLTAIYVEVYGQRADDPRIATMLSYARQMHELRLEALD